MFSVFACDRLPPLAEHLIEHMARDPLPPLTSEVVVVAQNRGLRGWLENELARTAGCAASLDTPSPRALCLRLARALGAAVVPADPSETAAVPRDPFDPDPLAWRIAAFLEDLPQEARYAPLHAYLDGGPDRRQPLARRIAGRFSDYQVYRPRLLQAWAEGESPYPDHPHASWQAPLWRRLTDQADRPDRARQLLALCDRLREERPGRGRLPERVSVFGAGLFPLLYLDVLAALARHVPVRFYLVGGGAAVENGNAVRRRLGRQRGVLRAWLKDHADTWERVPGDAPSTEGAPASALEAVQAGTRGEEEPGTAGESPFPVLPDDRSLHVHSCHSPRRELEVLRDQLLDAFEALPDLRPEDVLVLAPGLEQYAPLIETTFEAEEAGGLRLPVHIASAQWGEERRVLQAMEALLALPESRCTAPEVMELLDYPILRRAAGLASADVPLARRWIQEAGVRWGRAAAHREAFDLPPQQAGTWSAGLDRLLLGYVMGPADAFVQGRLPYAEANADRADVLGRLAAWLHRLFSFAEAAQAPRPLTAWSARLGTAVTDLLAPASPAEHDAVQHLTEAAHELEHLGALAPGTEAAAGQDASFAAVREHVAKAMREYEARAEHVTGRITFAEPMALRFAPHRVVAFLGLGNAFPPTPGRPADDLLAAAPRSTDHDAEREGAQLFCDALLAAEDRLILTYVGRSEKDDAERAPSAVLETLLECCETTLAAADAEGEETGDPVRERLVTEHPLQPFHPTYFTPGSALFSYDRAHGAARAARPSQNGRAPDGPLFAAEPLPKDDEDDPTADLRLDDLQRAWAHPAQYFCTRVLGLRLGGEAPLEAQEPMRPGGLTAYQVRQETLRMALADVPPETWTDRLGATGTLPPGRQGRAWYGRQREEAQQVAQTVQAQGERRPRTLRATGDGWAVTGRLDHVTDAGALAFRCAAPKAKDLARAWAAHLLLCASGDGDLPRTTLVLGTGAAAWRLQPLAEAEARHHLHVLVHGRRRIRRAPPPFFPETSMTFAETKSRYKARKAFRDTRWSAGEEGDSYVQLCFRGRDPLGDEGFSRFEKWANAFWKPLIEHRTEAQL